MASTFRDWLQEAPDGRMLAELIARRKYTKAIEHLLRLYKGGDREPGLRFTLAEVLVLAGRERQAVPVLMGLADELIASGVLPAAAAALDRVASIEPGRADLAARRAALTERACRHTFEDDHADDAPPTFASGEEQAAPPPHRPDPDEFTALATEAIEERKSEGQAFDTLETAPSAQEAELLELLHALAAPGAAAAEGEAATLARALLEDRSDEELLADGTGLQRRAFQPGDVLIAEGDRGTSVFLIRAGVVRILVRSAQGRDYQVSELGPGDFFGEIAAVSGRIRTATVAAASPGEALEIDKATLDRLVLDRPLAKLLLEEACVLRATNAESAAVRAVPALETRPDQALRALEAHFGERPWSPRMRLRLAHLLAKVGSYDEVVPLLVGLADELAGAGESRKAIAIFKKIERLHRRDVEEICLAPLARAAPEKPAPDAAADNELRAILDGSRPSTSEDRFRGWLLHLVRDAYGRSGFGAEARPAPAGPGLGAAGPLPA
jgi:CRP-like cAMP-binding protein